MYKFGSDLNVSNVAIDSSADEIEGNPLYNKSYNSATSMASSNPSSSSKAVLAALRALQDKIRKLEIERSQALDETAQLRHQLKNQEIEAEHIKQRESLASQKSLQEAKSAYDRLQYEKSEIESRLHNLEEKNKDLKNESEELHSKIRLLEEEKHSGSLRVKDLEYQKNQLENQLKMAQEREKGE